MHGEKGLRLCDDDDDDDDDVRAFITRPCFQHFPRTTEAVKKGEQINGTRGKYRHSAPKSTQGMAMMSSGNAGERITIIIMIIILVSRDKRSREGKHKDGIRRVKKFSAEDESMTWAFKKVKGQIPSGQMIHLLSLCFMHSK